MYLIVIINDLCTCAPTVKIFVVYLIIVSINDTRFIYFFDL